MLTKTGCKFPNGFWPLIAYIAFFIVYYALIIWMACKSNYPNSCPTGVHGFFKWFIIGMAFVIDGATRLMIYRVNSSERVREHEEYSIRHLPDRITKIYFIPRVFILMLMCRSIEMSHFWWDIYTIATAIVVAIVLIPISRIIQKIV